METIVLNDFDVLPLPTGDYELVNGHSVFQVRFDNEQDKALFDLVIEHRAKPSRDVVRRLVKKHGKPAVLAFFDKLKAAGIIYFDDHDGLERGRTFDKAEALSFKLAEAATRPIAIVSASPFGAMLAGHEILANAKMIDAATLTSQRDLDAALAPYDFVVVDATAYNPEILGRINRAAVAGGKPWLLVQGVYERTGHVGPLFYGRDTGCYKCFRDRLRSNVNARDTFDRYEAWLTAEGRFSQGATLPSTTFNRHLATVAAMEAEKFLLDYDIPQSYGYLLSIDPRTYAVEQHRLYKIPFCEVCNPNFEYRRAPWLDSVTLEAV
jgi:bacteriocin biosynthesis cyclodehydratase domain-containing protein